MKAAPLIGLVYVGVALAMDASTASRATVEHAAVELVAEKDGFQAGERNWVGIVIAHEPGWHTYWLNPGDSGLPTKLDWQLPKGYRAAEIAWPAPKRFDLGSLYNFGYDGTVLLPVPIDVPTAMQSGSNAALQVNARWLICSHEICLPGKTSLQLETIIADKPAANAKVAALFAKARAAQPKQATWHGEATIVGDRVKVTLLGAGLPKTAGLDIFAVTTKVIENSPPRMTQTGDRIVFDAAKSEYFDTSPAKLHLVLTQKMPGSEQLNAWQVEIPIGTAIAMRAPPR